MSIASPCVRNCCLNEQDLCMGCGRHIDEVVGWGNASEQRKQEVLERIAKRLTDDPHLAASVKLSQQTKSL